MLFRFEKTPALTSFVSYFKSSTENAYIVNSGTFLKPTFLTQVARDLYCFSGAFWGECRPWHIENVHL